MPRGLGRRLRDLLYKFKSRFADDMQLYPEVLAAFGALEVAVEEHFPRRRPLALGRPRLEPAGTIRKLRLRLKRLRKTQRQLKAEAKAAKVAKDKSNKNAITPEFLVKVALSWPSTVARSFATSWRDLVGVGQAGLSRISIDRIRDQFVEVIQQMRGEQCKQVVRSAALAATNVAASAPSSAAPGASSVAAPGASVTGIPCTAVLHIHDEASLRLRSSAETDTTGPNRSRSSKVQQHVVQVFVPDHAPMRWFSDLHPLADKSAKVLATSLLTILRQLEGPVCEGMASAKTTERPWFVHWLVGDGISTNEAAAKVVLAAIQAHPLKGHTRYFLMVVKCANHQANLVIGSVVSGKASIVGCRFAGLLSSPLADRPLAHANKAAATQVCGAVVRFFKFLVSDYYSEYLANLEDIVKQLAVVESSELQEQQCQKWRGMQALYGSSVLPDEVLECLNCNLTDWAHCCSSAAPGASSSAASGASSSAASGASSSAASGAFSSAASGASSSSAQSPENYVAGVRLKLLESLRKRILVVDEQPTLSRMFTFQAHIECFLLLVFLGCIPDILKARACKKREQSQKRVAKVLSFFAAEDTSQYLRRTALSLQLVGHTHGVCAQLRDDDEPLLVRLSKGVVSDAASSDLHRLLGSLYLDPELDVAATVAELIAVAMEICLRFKVYKQWPFQAWKLCRLYNREGYAAFCMQFLSLPEEQLDLGFGLPLRKLATAGRSEMESIRFLMSDSVQQCLVLSFTASAASSLPVERAFAHTKRSEAPRLCHVSTASRNYILRQHLRERQDLLDEAEQAAVHLRRTLRTNIQSLVFETKPELGQACLQGNKEQFQAFVKQHEQTLKAEVERRKAQARAIMDRVDLGSFPVTETSWLSWFRENAFDFRIRMRDAVSRRKLANRRMVASPELPQPALRIGITRPAVKKCKLAYWQQLCSGRHGWVCLKTSTQGVVVLFLLSHDGRTYAIDFTSHRLQRQEFVLGPQAYLAIDESIIALEDLHFGFVQSVNELLFSAATGAPLAATGASSAAHAPRHGRVVLTVLQAKPIHQPLKQRNQGKKRRTAVPTGSSDSDSSAAEHVSEAEIAAQEAKHQVVSSDSDSSNLSADTGDDMDTEATPDSVLKLVMAKHIDKSHSHCSKHKASDFVHSGSEDEDFELAAKAPGCEAANAPSVSGIARHPPGTWKIWEGTWFYSTKTPGFTDVKVILKQAFRNLSTGMGVTSMSKALSPHHYNEEWEEPVRTLLLLKSWCIWRARLHGWSKATECRQREVDRQVVRLTQELRVAQEGLPSRPLLGSLPAQKLLDKWVPDIVSTSFPP